MKILAWRFGLFSGAINAVCMFAYWSQMKDKADFSYGMLLGYVCMLVALSLIFVATYLYRKQLGGQGISFGRAFTLGLLIALISSVIYAFAWMFINHYLYPNFWDDYTVAELEKCKSAGLSDELLKVREADLLKLKEIYKNPFLAFLITITEILPIGTFVALLSALIFKRKPSN